MCSSKTIEALKEIYFYVCVHVHVGVFLYATCGLVPMETGRPCQIAGAIGSCHLIDVAAGN